MSIVEYGREVVLELESAGVSARLFGGAAVVIRAQQTGKTIKLRRIKDLDVVVLAKAVKRATAVLRASGWLIDRRSLMFSDSRKIMLLNPNSQIHLDLFSDPLIFNQKITIGPRLSLHPITLSLADLLLTKLQIAKPTLQDLRDVSLLLGGLESLGEDSLVEEFTRIAGCCSHNWGLYRSCIDNLHRVEVDAAEEVFGVDFPVCIARRLIDALDRERKSIRWHARALVGTRVRWYSEVD